MKVKLLLIFFLLHAYRGYASKDSLINTFVAEYEREKDDVARVGMLGRLSYAYQYIDFNKSIYYAEEGLALAKKIDYQFGIAKSYNFLGLANATVGKMDKALMYYLSSLKINTKGGFTRETGKNLNNISEVLILIKDYENAEAYLKKAYDINTKYKNSNSTAITLSLFAELYQNLNKFDLAYESLEKAKKIEQTSKGIFDDGFYYMHLGNVQLAEGNDSEAKKSFNKVLSFAESEPDQIIISYCGLSEIAFKSKQFNECKLLLNKALDIANQSNAQLQLLNIYEALADLSYEINDDKQTIKYLRLKDDLRNVLLGYEATGQITKSLSKIITEQKEVENEILRSEKKFREQEIKQQQTTLLVLILGIVISLLFAILAFVNFNRKKKAYSKLAEANETITQHNANLEEAIANRTNVILKHNTKLKELAYFNSHRIRRHLANIQGLIFLMEDEKEDKLKYMDMIEKEMKSLDHTITEINHLIERKL